MELCSVVRLGYTRPIPRCDQSNPCENGGQCTSIDHIDYTCICTETDLNIWSSSSWLNGNSWYSFSNPRYVKTNGVETDGYVGGGMGASVAIDGNIINSIIAHDTGERIYKVDVSTSVEALGVLLSGFANNEHFQTLLLSQDNIVTIWQYGNEYCQAISIQNFKIFLSFFR